MDDTQLRNVAVALNSLTIKYTNGSLKHYQYAAEYDKVLEQHGISKKQLWDELSKRNIGLQ